MSDYFVANIARAAKNPPRERLSIPPGGRGNREGKTKLTSTFLLTTTWARVHHKVVGHFGSEADARSLYYRR